MTGDRPRHTVVVDLGYGDAGKGAVVDRLCRSDGVDTVVRFNGGAQAGHNVVTRDGRQHTFAQFGSGTFVPGVRTHLSRFMLVDPLALAAEAAHLRTLGVRDAFARLTVDRRALLTTPYHAAANRHREAARGTARHGSCGLGVGETARYALAHPRSAPTAGDCAAPARLLTVLTRLRERLTDELGLGAPLGPPPEDCATAFRAFAEQVALADENHLAAALRRGPVVLEGAQGVLLDEWHGFHPYTTWSTTTFGNAGTLLAEAGAAPGSALRLGVLRTYTVRHGPGPLVTENPALGRALPEPHNGHGRWQGAFRRGDFDAVAHRYALAVCARSAFGAVQALALTHLDAPARHPYLSICETYDLDGDEIHDLPTGPPGDLRRQAALTTRLLRARPGRTHTPGPDPHSWAEVVADTLDTPVLLRSHGPRAVDRLPQDGPGTRRVRGIAGVNGVHRISGVRDIRDSPMSLLA
ncbi:MULTISPECIES: adenylosuccinate synthetase [Streptacidiphilus]|uniref:Adenylosuccinate synthetase n=1 Tax=Streptacidiphilus cavernicola TaxID=3342716 RepID=A0ABV6URF9_9ACTN|nr:adenylosuccinate synthetase [Streptacidiphilus jeojiense]